MCDSTPFRMEAGAKRALLYDASCIDAIDTWSAARDGSMHYPDNTSMTDEETDTYLTTFTEISTYVAETLPKFILGELNLEGDFDAYINQVETMGMADCMKAKQAAYDRYMQK